MKSILNIEDAEFEDWTHGDRFEAWLGTILTRMGAEKLAYNTTVFPPVQTRFPGPQPPCHRRDVSGPGRQW